MGVGCFAYTSVMYAACEFGVEFIRANCFSHYRVDEPSELRNESAVPSVQFSGTPCLYKLLLEVWFSIAGGSKRFSHSPKRPDWITVTTNACWVFFTGGEAVEREGVYSRPACTGLVRDFLALSGTTPALSCSHKSLPP